MEVSYLESGSFNNLLLDEDGHVYTKRSNTESSQYWYCRSRKCPGSITVVDTRAQKGASHKSNCCEKDIVIEKLKFQSKLRRMCRENLETSYSDLYYSLATEFPNAIQRVKYETVRRSMFYWRYPHLSRMPRTMIELDNLMKEPHYYKEFGTMNREDNSSSKDNRMFEGAHAVATSNVNGEPITSHFIAFKNSDIINMIKGRRIRIAGDGTFSIRPRKSSAGKQYFDNAKEVYSVHVVFGKKFYTFATFVIQHSTKEVMLAMFNLLNEWLQTDTVHPTEIISFMSDYECSSRLAVPIIWPACKISGCSVHFQRAIFRFAKDQHIYGDKTKVFERNLVSQVFGMCYLPEENMKMATDVIQQQAVGPSEAFGTKLVKRLREYWLPRKISVANEEFRCNNGSEVFHWASQRMHTWLKNNILDFVNFVHKLHQKSSAQFCQWLSVQQSKKQKRLEKFHVDLQAKLQNEIVALGEEKAVLNFLKNATCITKSSQKVFENVNLNLDDAEVDYSELYIQDNTSTSRVASETSIEKITMSMTFSGDGIGLMSGEKQIVFHSSREVPVGRATVDHRSAKDNLYFAHSSLCHIHAEVRLIDGVIYVRDLGSIKGTFINCSRISRSGTTSQPRQIGHGDKVCFGDVETTINLPQSQASQATKTQIPATAVIKCTCDDIEVPERVISLNSIKETIIGKSRPEKPPSTDNGFFKESKLAYKHASLWYTNHTLYIKPYGAVLIGNVPIDKATPLIPPTIITLLDSKCMKYFKIHLHTCIPAEVAPKTPQCKILFLPAASQHSNFQQKTIRFERNQIRIGRSDTHHPATNNNGLFDCGTISEEHALFHLDDGKVFLEDKGSRRGSFVNNKKLLHGERRLVQNFDFIQFGSTGSDRPYIRTQVKIVFFNEAELGTEINPTVTVTPSTPPLFEHDQLELDMQSDHPNPQEEIFYECEICQAEYQYQHQLDLHMESDHPNPMVIPQDEIVYTCEICQAEYQYQHQLELHMQSDHPNPQEEIFYECEICQAEYQYQHQLDLHMESDHPNPMVIPQDEIVYTCEICQAEYQYQHQLQFHMQSDHPNPMVIPQDEM